MKIQYLILLFLIFFVGCTTPKEDHTALKKVKWEHEMVFDKAKWSTKEGWDYPYRDKMLKDIVYNDTIRALTKVEILNLLGEPNRSTENHLYYTITQKRLGFWPLHTKTLVIKFTESNTVTWIKIHE